MKIKTNLFRPFSAVTLLTIILAASSPLHAATFTWTGADAVTGSWAPTSSNWDTAPTFNNTADLIFNDLTRATSNETGFTRLVRSITFGDNIDATWTTNMTSAAILTFTADSGNASLDVTSGATGNITFNGGTGITGSQSLTSQLEIDHNGSGLLTFNRQTAGAGGITKTGTGTFVMTGFNANSFTGPLNVNGGRLVLNNTQGATQDLAAAVAIDLGGGTLEARTNGTFGKTLSQNITVSAASAFAYKNDTTTNRQMTLNTGSLVLNADLTVQNISTDTSLANAIVINRNLTGTENLIVETYNNVNSGTANYNLGRVALGGANASWSGDLIIRQGTAEVFGDSALGQVNVGTGDIIIGETANAFGAGFLTSASTAGGKIIANNVMVRSGGFRTIRGGSDHSYTFTGTVALEGDLNIHNGLFFHDKFMIFSGNFSGAGDLNLTAGTLGDTIRLSGDNSMWTGDLTIAQGVVEVRGASDLSVGSGLITLGATGNTREALVTFIPGAAGGTTLTYENNITATSGGPRTIGGENTNHTLTLTGNITLDGDLIVNHNLSVSDRRINLDGPISGSGGLTITRTGGSTETTLRMAGTKNYLGLTTIADTASLALADTCLLTSSSVLVQAGGRIGGPGTIGGNLTFETPPEISPEKTAKFYFFVGSSTPETYVPMKVNGTVTTDSSFGVASIVGGSRGEAVPWASIPDGTYTLIANTASTFNTISNFGAGNAVADVAGSGKTVYFQNGGGSGSGGLQIVVTTAAADPFTTWSDGALFGDDTNNDGIENGLAFLLGAADVDANANGLLPSPTQSAGALTLTFTMRDSAARGDASLQVQHSSDLGITDAWSTPVTVPDATSTVGGINFTVTAGTPPLNNVTATIPASGNASGGKLFSRVIGNP